MASPLTEPAVGRRGTDDIDSGGYSDVMRRRARWWITAAVALVLAAASAAYLGVTRTHSLEYGSLFSWESGTPNQDSSTVSYPLRNGHEVEVGISIRNPGPVSITLIEVSLPQTSLVVEEVTVIAGNAWTADCCRPEQAKPFHPVEVGAGEEAVAWLTLRLTGAHRYDPCTRFILVNADVAYTILGTRRYQAVPLPMGLSFDAPCDAAAS
ncbi:MAG: hypothetical protein IRY85_17260 [Micromonosporaceae bacterium]|nr:hypothetical protein [Micromonosporaceae bacterium]